MPTAIILRALLAAGGISQTRKGHITFGGAGTSTGFTRIAGSSQDLPGAACISLPSNRTAPVSLLPRVLRHLGGAYRDGSSRRG